MKIINKFQNIIKKSITSFIFKQHNNNKKLMTIYTKKRKKNILQNLEFNNKDILRFSVMNWSLWN